jgi:exonuclease SbcC
MAAATARLKQLSGGRYALERRPDDGRIDVLDYDNAREPRSAETLSGGETFLASLALALALSEQVQSSGGTLLDSLFIDEGFGSLDPQSLDTAIDAIESLQTGGRMIGVISHVDALHERLRQRVVVEKRPEGSVVSVVS